MCAGTVAWWLAVSRSRVTPDSPKTNPSANTPTAMESTARHVRSLLCARSRHTLRHVTFISLIRHWMMCWGAAQFYLALPICASEHAAHVWECTGTVPPLSVAEQSQGLFHRKDRQVFLPSLAHWDTEHTEQTEIHREKLCFLFANLCEILCEALCSNILSSWVIFWFSLPFWPSWFS